MNNGKKKECDETLNTNKNGQERIQKQRKNPQERSLEETDLKQSRISKRASR